MLTYVVIVTSSCSSCIFTIKHNNHHLDFNEACADDFSGALFWNSNRRNTSVTQRCSILHPSFRSGISIERHCNNYGIWSPVDMTNCTMFIGSNPVITVHFTLTVSDSNTMDSTTIINNVSP